MKKRAAIYRQIAEKLEEEQIHGICWAFRCLNIMVYAEYNTPGIIFSDVSIKQYPELDIYNRREYCSGNSTYLNCTTDDRIIMMLLLAEIVKNK